MSESIWENRAKAVRESKPRVICAWCESTPDNEAVSHGLCDSCAARLLDEAHAMRKN